MTVWTWSQSRCGRDRVEPRVFPLPFGWEVPPALPAELRARTRAVHARFAHTSAVAGPSWPLARWRGMALPVVVGGIPATDAGAAHAGRRRAKARRDTGNDAGGHRPT